MLPASYRPAVLRCVTPSDGEVIGIGFDVSGGEVLRLKISCDDAGVLIATLQQMLDAQRKEAT